MDILNYPDPILRFKTLPLKKVNASIRDCASEMIEVMKSEDGVGLAANQVGLPFRMFVMDYKGDTRCFINPVVRSYGRVREIKEGCLSLPDIYATVRRSSKCHLQAFDLTGIRIDTELTGDWARIVQHEVDHLDGVLFIDRLTGWERNTRPLGPALAGMEQGWRNCPRPTPKYFQALQHEYCGVPKDGSV